MQHDEKFVVNFVKSSGSFALWRSSLITTLQEQGVVEQLRNKIQNFLKENELLESYEHSSKPLPDSDTLYNTLFHEIQCSNLMQEFDSQIKRVFRESTELQNEIRNAIREAIEEYKSPKKKRRMKTDNPNVSEITTEDSKYTVNEPQRESRTDSQRYRDPKSEPNITEDNNKRESNRQSSDENVRIRNTKQKRVSDERKNDFEDQNEEGEDAVDEDENENESDEVSTIIQSQSLRDVTHSKFEHKRIRHSEDLKTTRTFKSEFRSSSTRTSQSPEPPLSTLSSNDSSETQLSQNVTPTPSQTSRDYSKMKPSKRRRSESDIQYQIQPTKKQRFSFSSSSSDSDSEENKSDSKSPVNSFNREISSIPSLHQTRTNENQTKRISSQPQPQLQLQLQLQQFQTLKSSQNSQSSQSQTQVPVQSSFTQTSLQRLQEKSKDENGHNQSEE